MASSHFCNFLKNRERKKKGILSFVELADLCAQIRQTKSEDDQKTADEYGIDVHMVKFLRDRVERHG